MRDDRQAQACVTCAYRAHFLDGPEAMYASSADGRFVDVNRKLCIMLGYKREELMALPVEAVYEFPRERRRFVYEIESHGVARGFKIRLKRSDGKVLPCEIDASAWKGSDGKPAGYIGSIRHRSPSGDRLTRYENEEDRYSLALRGSNDGLWEWEPLRRRAFFSPRWKALLGYAVSEIGEDMDEWFRRVHPDDGPRFKEALERYLKQESPIFSCYHRMRRRDGSYGWFMGRGAAEFSDKGSVLRIAGSLTDVSDHIAVVERLRGEEGRLARRNADLERERELLARFVPLHSGRRNDAAELLKPVRREASVLWIKLRGSLDLVEGLGPERFAELMGELTTDIIDLVEGRGGCVARIAGDSLMASFGCPAPLDGAAEAALRCALDLREWLRTFNEVRPAWLSSPIGFGMGLAHGELFSAAIGSVRRLEHVLFGAAASRAQLYMEQSAAGCIDILVGAEYSAILGPRVEVEAAGYGRALRLVGIALRG